MKNYFLSIILLFFTITKIGEGWECPENEIREKSGLGPDHFYNYILNSSAVPKCYKAWTKGPCNGTLGYYWSPTIVGTEQGSCENILPLINLGKINRPIAESLTDGKTYFVYDQANCKDNEWLVFDKQFQGICQENPCLNISLQDALNETEKVNTTLLNVFLDKPKYYWATWHVFSTTFGLDPFPETLNKELHKPFWFLHEGKCYKYFSQGPCPKGEVIVFKGTNPIPVCYSPEFVSGPMGMGGGATNSGQIKCKNGIVIGDKCVPTGGASELD